MKPMPELNLVSSLPRKTWKKERLNGEKEKVAWDELARATMREAYNYIKADSVQQAKKVKQEIIAASKKLADLAEMHPL